MGLDIPRDRKLERLNWIFERIAWSAMAVVVVAALLGLFGPGLLGPSVARSSDGALQVEYSRFIRARAPTLVRFHFESNSENEAALWMGSAYLDSFASELVRPTPESVALGSGRVRYSFRLNGEPGPVTVTFRLESRTIGRIRAEAGLENGSSLAFWQFVYP